MLVSAVGVTAGELCAAHIGMDVVMPYPKSAVVGWELVTGYQSGPVRMVTHNSKGVTNIRLPYAEWALGPDEMVELPADES